MVLDKDNVFDSITFSPPCQFTTLALPHFQVLNFDTAVRIYSHVPVVARHITPWLIDLALSGYLYFAGCSTTSVFIFKAGEEARL